MRNDVPYWLREFAEETEALRNKNEQMREETKRMREETARLREGRYRLREANKRLKSLKKHDGFMKTLEELQQLTGKPKTEILKDALNLYLRSVKPRSL